MSHSHSGDVGVLLVDDHPAVRKSLKLLLQDAGLQVSEASDGTEALTECRRLRPRIVILDICMPQVNGFECAREITTMFPDIGVVFLTSQACDEYARAALQFGGAPLLLKKDAVFGLVPAIDALLQGKTRVSRAS